MMDSGDKKAQLMTEHMSWKDWTQSEPVLTLDLTSWSTQLETVTMSIKKEYEGSLPKIDVVHLKVLSRLMDFL